MPRGRPKLSSDPSAQYHTSAYGLSDLRPSSIMQFLPRFLANTDDIASRYEEYSTVAGFVPFLPPDFSDLIRLPRWVLVGFTFAAVGVFFGAMSWVLNHMLSAEGDELQGLLADKDEFDDGD